MHDICDSKGRMKKKDSVNYKREKDSPLGRGGGPGGHWCASYFFSYTPPANGVRGATEVRIVTKYLNSDQPPHYLFSGYTCATQT